MVAAVAMVFGSSALALVAVPFLVLGVGGVAGILLRREAWAFIPERRKLGSFRPVPLTWLSRVKKLGQISALSGL
jgi:hypothetical protein